jgi:hypothetical protein
MKKIIVAGAFIVGGVLGTTAVASAEPPTPPPGTTIQAACGVSFGQLVGPAKKAGTATHSNYAGGAKALVPLAAAHGCG